MGDKNMTNEQFKLTDNELQCVPSMPDALRAIGD